LDFTRKVFLVFLIIRNDRNDLVVKNCQPTILIVEDERELADTYAEWLAADYEVIVTYSASSAIEKLTDDIDVALLDRRLPGMSGNAIIEQINHRNIECRIAMITAVDPDFDVLDMGFDEYLIKPVLKDDLTDCVNRLLRLKTYDEQFKESYALATKQRILENEKSVAELDEHQEYREAVSRLHELQEQIDGMFTEFTRDDYQLIYEELDANVAQSGTQ
jgi:DNA-binding response OmpR family regulator